MKSFSLEGSGLSFSEAWLLIVLWGAYVFFLVRLLRGPSSPGRKTLLAVARAMALLLASVLIWNPVFTVRHRSRAPVAVVLDESASMGTLDAGKSSRAKAAAEALSKGLPLFRERSAPVFFRVGDRLERVDGFSAEARGLSSDFAPLAQLPSLMPGLKAVFFVSDGRRGGGPDPLPLLAPLGVPVYAVGVGDPSASPDLAVEDVRVPPFGFKNTDAQASVRLGLRALPPGRAELKVLSARGELLGRRTVEWNHEEVLEATVPFRPSRAGVETFRVQASVFPGETNVRNNVFSFPWEVDRDRRRILYICGRPGPNYAFLRQELKSDPTVELVSFVILRDPEDVVSVPDRELSLIPFPGQESLLEGLPGFDAVIFEDFSFTHFGVGQPGMEALQRFVEGGGGFLLMTEGSELGPSSPYRGSPMEDLLPFRLDLPPVEGPRLFRAAPWSAGQFLTDLDPADGAEVWRQLPALSGSGLFPFALRPRAAPFLGVGPENGRTPWAALMSAGKGRTMVMGCLSTWRWALGESGQGRGAGTYSRFWGRVLSWLTGGEDFQRVRIETPSLGVTPGEESLLRIYVRDEARRPVADADVRLEIREPAGAPREEKAAAAGDGEYVVSFTPRSPGTIFLRARAFQGGGLLGESKDFVKSGAAWDESRDVSPDFPFLKEMSRATGGRFTTLGGFDEDWIVRALDDASWETGRRISVGGWAALGLLLLILLLSEWIFRRWRGLP